MTVFVDTSALFAVLDANDQDHARAATAWREMVAGHEALLTSNYVLLESIALLQRRLGLAAVEDLLADIAPLIQVHWVEADVHQEALTTLLAERRRYLSLVDCVSFAVMRRHNLERVFGFDRHFGEQGFTVIP